MALDYLERSSRTSRRSPFPVLIPLGSVSSCTTVCGFPAKTRKNFQKLSSFERCFQHRMWRGICLIIERDRELSSSSVQGALETVVLRKTPLQAISQLILRIWKPTDARGDFYFGLQVLCKNVSIIPRRTWSYLELSGFHS